MRHHYKTLELTEDCSLEEVKKSYKRLALKYHPDKNKEPDSEEKFKKIQSAYDALCNYHANLKSGQKPSPRPRSEPTYEDSPQNFAGFKQSSQTSNSQFFHEFPHTDHLSTCPMFFSPHVTCNCGGKPTNLPKDPPIEKSIQVTFEELYKGCTRKLKISRKIQKNRAYVTEVKILTMNIKPGWKSGTKVVFRNEGDRNMNKIPADIVFTIHEIPHKLYTRNGNDILYTHSISYIDVIERHPLAVPLPDGAAYCIAFRREFLDPDKVWNLTGLGFPDTISNQKGDMILTITIKYPNFWKDDARQRMEYLLNSLSNH